MNVKPMSVTKPLKCVKINPRAGGKVLMKHIWPDVNAAVFEEEQSAGAIKLTNDIAAVLAKGDIEFERGKSDIMEPGKAILREAAKLLLEVPDLAIGVDAHSSCIKCPQEKCMNPKLSEDRAESVLAFLQAEGCKNSFSATGWGCVHPEVGAQKLVRIYTGSKAPPYDGVFKSNSLIKTSAKTSSKMNAKA
jgi:outer membrane protein OmpA-like peptidoglycan-associated protein